MIIPLYFHKNERDRYVHRGNLQGKKLTLEF